MTKCQKLIHLFCQCDMRPTNTSSADSIVMPLVIPIMMPSQAVGNIIIKSQAHMNDATKGYI